MPNWCLNTLTIEAESKDKLEEVLAFIKSEDEPFSLEKIHPIPQEIADTPHKSTEDGIERIAGLLNGEVKDYRDWWEWSLAEWGCKWDIEGGEVIDMDEDNLIALSFDSANSPPIPIVQRLNEKYEDVDFTLRYFEPGCCFGGIFSKSDDTRYDDQIDADAYQQFAIDEFGWDFDNEDEEEE